jgi:hypothetical protein
MPADDRTVCPACFGALLPLKDGEHRHKCPQCGHVLGPPEHLQQTAAHTPTAKRRTTPPPDEE